MYKCVHQYTILSMARMRENRVWVAAIGGLEGNTLGIHSRDEWTATIIHGKSDNNKTGVNAGFVLSDEDVNKIDIQIISIIRRETGESTVGDQYVDAGEVYSDVGEDQNESSDIPRDITNDISDKTVAEVRRQTEKDGGNPDEAVSVLDTVVENDLTRSDVREARDRAIALRELKEEENWSMKELSENQGVIRQTVSDRIEYARNAWEGVFYEEEEETQNVTRDGIDNLPRTVVKNIRIQTDGGDDTIPVRVNAVGDTAALSASLADNDRNSQSDMNPVDRAIALRELKDENNWSYGELGDNQGVPEQTIIDRTEHARDVWEGVFYDKVDGEKQSREFPALLDTPKTVVKNIRVQTVGNWLEYFNDFWEGTIIHGDSNEKEMQSALHSDSLKDDMNKIPI